MKKSKMILALAGFVLMAATAITAQADPPKGGDCPEGWGAPVRVADAKDEKEAKKNDKNNDQWVCEKDKDASGHPHYKDNNKKKKD